MADQKTVELIGEFDEMTVARLPLAIDAEHSVFLAIFWEGQTVESKPRLEVCTPDGEVLRLRLPSPKRFYWNQVQMTSLAGFSLRHSGSYAFEVSTDSGACAHTLRVLSASAVDVMSPDEAEREIEHEASED
jgi:hypothetical protein